MTPANAPQRPGMEAMDGMFGYAVGAPLSTLEVLPSYTYVGW